MDKKSWALIALVFVGTYYWIRVVGAADSGNDFCPGIATITRVVDGDTLDLKVDLGYDLVLENRFRLEGIDTPEKYGVKKGSDEHTRGVAASEFVKKWAAKNKFQVSVHSGRKRGKYGRWIARVCSLIDGECLGDALLQAGHAVRKVY